MNEKIEIPDLTKMTSKELEKYKLKVVRLYYSYFDGGPWDKELTRVNKYIYSIEKKIVITEKDIAEIVKKKKRMRGDREVIVSGVGIICDQSKNDGTHRLSVEYYF